MRTVYKYSIPVDGESHDIDIPAGGRFIRCESQHDPNTVEFWVEVDTTQPLATQRLRVIGTGHRINDNEILCGTTPTTHGFVWHLLLQQDFTDVGCTL